MSTSASVARGTTRLLAGLLSAKGLDFFFYLFLARQLGVEEFGHYTFAISFALLFNTSADLGTTTIVTREASRAPERTRRLLGQALIIKLGLALFTILMVLGSAWVAGTQPGTLLLIAVFVAAMLINSTAFLFEGLLKASGRAGSAGLSIAAQSLTAVSVGLVLVFSGWGALGGAGAYLCGSLAHLGAAAFWSRNLWGRGASHDSGARWSGTLALMRETAPLALSGVFIAVYFRIDAVLLKFFHGETAVGLYGGTHRFFEGLILFSMAYRSVLYPIMSRAADGPAEALSVLCRKSIRLLLTFTVGVAVFMSLNARDVITFLLGEAYAPSAPALALIVWALPGAFMADMVLHLLTAQRRQWVVARVLGTVALFNVVLNVLLIPRFSFVGSAGAAAATETLSFTLMFLALGHAVPKIGLIGAARGPIVAGLITAGVSVLLAPLNPGGLAGLSLMGALAAATYLIALWTLGVLGRAELELVRGLLPNRASRAHGGARTR